MNMFRKRSDHSTNDAAIHHNNVVANGDDDSVGSSSSYVFAGEGTSCDNSSSNDNQSEEDASEDNHNNRRRASCMDETTTSGDDNASASSSSVSVRKRSNSITSAMFSRLGGSSHHSSNQFTVRRRNSMSVGSSEIANYSNHNNNHSSNHHNGDTNVSGGGTTTSTMNGGGGIDIDRDAAGWKIVEEYTQLETQRVERCRIVVLLVVLCIGVSVSYITYYLLNQKPQHQAYNDFHLLSNKMKENFHYHISQMFEATESFSRTITATSIGTEQQFPYVTIQSFEGYARELRTKAFFDLVYYAPIINSTEMDSWFNFSIANYEWPMESKQLYNVYVTDDEQLSNVTSILQQPPPIMYMYENYSPTMQLAEWNNTGSSYDPIMVSTMYMSPPTFPETYPYMNMNWYTEPKLKALSLAANQLNSLTFSGAGIVHEESVSGLLGVEQSPSNVLEEINCVVAIPVHKDVSSDPDRIKNPVMAYGYGIFSWSSYIKKISPSGVHGIQVVLHNSCGDVQTYELNGDDVTVVGTGDVHDTRYDGHMKIIDFTNQHAASNEVLGQMDGHCQYHLAVYPTLKFVSSYHSVVPWILCISVASIFVVIITMFIFYDRVVQSRNDKVIAAAARSNAIVSNLFPSNVRDRLLAEKKFESDLQKQKKSSQNNTSRFATTNIRKFIEGHHSTELQAANHGNSVPLSKRSVVEKDQETPAVAVDIYKSKPIADFFPDTTILFGDIVGFTAWSSVREPTQVFTLLETVYHAFDDIARRRRVFKVETVGDCYVAVCGLPDPRKDHAVTMCRFARDCMFRMWALVKKLETSLGPDTSDLTMRMGLHSGPVTAGVLRGERSRFQLFGDTVNTAARMEHNGVKSKIQISEETANILLSCGKKSWVSLREDKINAKGKGEMQTYWLELGGQQSEAKSNSAPNYVLDSTDHASLFSNFVDESTNGNQEEMMITEIPMPERPVCSDKVLRLIGWNVEVLLRLLKQIIARRNATTRRSRNSLPIVNEDLIAQGIFGAEMVLDEVKEIIELPQFDARAAKNQQDTESVEIDPRLPQQLEDYVMTIGSGYRDNPFHNFEHAAHVTMSVVKLLSRIVAPSDHYSDGSCPNKDDASSLHDHTYGITSDPLTQFSCVLSALIHDLDHPGVPNAQLVKEGSPLAKHYKDKSVAEQNSVDMAWMLLMQPKYNELRAAIYSSEAEMKRFRQLVVNSVMATDIVDKELKALRNARWDKAFSQEDNTLENVHDQINRKATIVIEHLIQASDVAHTMQHWHIYRKWNERFFMECYQAFKMGRAETDPSISWYQGEIGFFDFYIIPLAKKLKNCGVFGVSSDEYLNYAMKNRKEWEDRGQEIVNDMIEKVNAQWRDDGEYPPS